MNRHVRFGRITRRDKDAIIKDDAQIICEIVLRGGGRSDSRGEETSHDVHTHVGLDMCRIRVCRAHDNTMLRGRYFERTVISAVNFRVWACASVYRMSTTV